MEDHSIGELATLAGVTPRTIRYYISIGLLPSPGQVGPGSRYGAGHLARLRLIRQLQREHLPLGEIGRRLESLDDEAVVQAMEGQASAAPAGSALDYIRRLRADRGGEAAPALAPARSHATVLVSQATPPARPASEEARVRTADRTRWEHVWLGDGVELHIRQPRARGDHKQIDRLIRLGRELLEGRDRQ